MPRQLIQNSFPVKRARRWADGGAGEVDDHAGVRGERDTGYPDPHHEAHDRGGFDDEERPPPLAREADPVEAVADELRRPQRQHDVDQQNEGEQCGQPPDVREENHDVASQMAVKVSRRVSVSSAGSAPGRADHEKRVPT